MKSIFLSLIGGLLLGSCGNNSPKSANAETETTIISSTESEQPQTEDSNQELTVKAKFIEFSLDDASHYTFEDAKGKTWDFVASNSKNFEFARELPLEEANEENQGWGSPKELQGKWFKLSYTLEERELYIDGPIGTVKIIVEAKLVDN